MPHHPFSHASESTEPGFCPVTGLPITIRPEWTDLRLDEHYTASFALIGNAILHVVPKGNPTAVGSRKLLEERAKILDSVNLTEKHYAEIRDYKMLTGRPSKEAG